MNVNTMRLIDRWAGIPLTAVVTVALKLVDLFRRPIGKTIQHERTLFIELSEMGSAIIADPAMKKLQREGGSELFFVIFKDNAKSLDLLKTVNQDNVFLMRADNLINLAIDIVKFTVWCREKRITATIDLELFSRFTALLSAFSGARHRVGFSTLHDEGCYRGDIINHPVRYNNLVHIAQNFLSLINTTLGHNKTAYSTTPIHANELVMAQAPRDESAIDTVREKIKTLYPDLDNQRIVLFNPNASELLPQRRWLPESFAQVATNLLDRYPDIIILITGAPSEREEAANLVLSINNERCVNSAGVFQFEELIPLYQQSSMMITNDSGPGHFSSVTPLKVFVIFGPETPALYGSLGNAENIYLNLPCSPCVSAHNHRKTSCTERPCITGISPEMVTQRLTHYLDGIDLAQQP